MSCGTCKYFVPGEWRVAGDLYAQWAVGPTDKCRLYPGPVVRRDYWCGEYGEKDEKNKD